jgi:nickel-dependent lactate racemase
MVVGEGSPAGFLSRDVIRDIVATALPHDVVARRRLLVIIPDGTRTMPMPLMAGVFDETLAPHAAALDYLVALGTHQPMSDAHLSSMLGRGVRNGRAGTTGVFNHAWHDPATFVTLGTISRDEIAELTGGLLARDVPVALNRLVREYDRIVICGPVFPHEVVGFSGGTKYFCPGIAGQDIIDFTHWLGALLTSREIIGSGYTPVRAVIDRAAELVDRPVTCLSLVVTHAGVAGLYGGTPRDSWKAASSLSAQVHIRRIDRPFQRVLSIMPPMYADLWTAAKGMYKLEPVVADGGELVIFAPHITEVSYTHGPDIDAIGYHCRDYFVHQWDRFAHHHGGVLAHSTHLKGCGTFDLATGIESPRIAVTLATGIPAERCARLNLGYMDPASVRRDEWEGREDEGILVVHRAGETLYRLKQDD